MDESFSKTTLNLAQPIRAASENHFARSVTTLPYSPPCIFVLKCRSTLPSFGQPHFSIRKFPRKWLGNSSKDRSATHFQIFPLQCRSIACPATRFSMVDPCKTDFYRIAGISMHTAARLLYLAVVISFDLSREKSALLAQTVGQSRRSFKSL